MLKKILGLVILCIWILVIYVQHSAVFDSSNVSFFWNRLDLSGYIDSSYIKYFMLKDENPRYVWNSQLFKWYTDYCHENSLNCIVFPHQQFYTDLMWIWSIQYIGSVIDSLSAKYLYNLLDNLTTLNPYWDYPYVFWELLLPGNKRLANQVDLKLLNKSWHEGVEIWEKAKKYNCNSFKIFLISWLNHEEYYKQVYIKPTPVYYKNPCDLWDITWYLGFNYFYYLGNYQESANNYKIASFNEDSPWVYPSMYGIVQGKWWNHEKILQIWFAKFISFQEQILTAKTEESLNFNKEQASDALKKWAYELQLSIINNADQKVSSDSSCYHNYKCLVEKELIKMSLQDLASSCANTKVDDSLFSWTVLLTEQKKQDFYNNVRCILLWYSIQNKYIDLKNYKLEYPFKEKLGNKVSFGWDSDFNEWKVENK